MIGVSSFFAEKRTDTNNGLSPQAEHNVMVSNSPMGLDFLKPTGHLTLNGSMLDGAAWEILSRPEEWNSPACRRDWQGLVDNSDNLNLIYQSPDWFGHLQQTEGERRLALAVCRDKSGRTIAVAPLRIARFPFRFQGRPQGDMVNCASRLVKIGRSHRVHMPGRSTGFWARRLSDPEPAERPAFTTSPSGRLTTATSAAGCTADCDILRGAGCIGQISLVEALVFQAFRCAKCPLLSARSNI